jgi:hypothetical protein
MFKKIFFFGALSLGLAINSVPAQSREARIERLRKHEAKLSNIMDGKRGRKTQAITAQFNETGTITIKNVAYWISKKAKKQVIVDPSLDKKTKVSFDIDAPDLWKALQEMAKEKELVAFELPDVGYTLGNKDWTVEKALQTMEDEKEARIQQFREHQKKIRQVIQRKREQRSSPNPPATAEQTTVSLQKKQGLVTVAIKNGKIDSVLAIISSQIKGFVTTQGTVSGSRISLLQEEVPIQMVLEQLCTDMPWYWWEDSAGNYVLIDLETYQSQFKNNQMEFHFPHQVTAPPRLTPAPDKNSPPVTVATSDGRLGSVCEILSKQTNLTFTFHGTVTGEKLVTILAEQQPLEMVLELICSPNNWVWWKDSEMSYAISDQVFYQKNIQQK